MAMSQDEMYRLMDDIINSGGDTELMRAHMAQLRAEYDEREGMLRHYRETYDGENALRYRASEYDAVVSERDRYREDAERYRQMYIDRFTGRGAGEPQTAFTANSNDERIMDYDTLLYGRREEK